MAYSTVTKIRDEAGFTGNTNVTDAKITTYQAAATSFIDGRISRVYSLPLDSTPDILELIERKLAAGHLLLDEYGEQAEGTSKDGNEKVKWAEGQLELIVSGALPLIDSSTNEELEAVETYNMKGLPDDSTGTDKTDQANKDDPPIFEIGETF